MIVVRLLLTAAIVIGAIFGIVFIWTTYFENPWTRDAYVRADIIQVASYVPGGIADLAVVDNQRVEKGDLLVQIDRRGYELDVAEAQARVEEAKAEFALQKQQSDRLTALQNRDTAAIANVDVADAQLQTASARASLIAAQQALRSANLALERTTISAPASGYVTNLDADTGDFVSEGSPFLAIVDQNSFRVDAYFMETKLPSIEVGDRARLRLMSSGRVLEGRVQGVARGIQGGQGGGSQLLAAPDPSFQWIRLAQRIPVRIDIVDGEGDTRLIAGETVSVIVEPGNEASDGVFGWIGTRMTRFMASLN